MKFKFFLLTVAAALMAGCTDELDRGGVYSLEDGITATIPTYPFDDGTRVNISDDLQSFTWSDNDKLGIYYSDNNVNAFAGFQLKQGGSSTGSFENKVFALNPSTTYYAFYPFNADAIVDEAPVDFTGQVQNGNGSASHLGAYNYMYGTLATDGQGKGSVSFKNLGSVMQLRLTVSHSAIYTDVDIKSSGTKFITKGTASMADGSITATETSASIHLDFKNGIALSAGDVLTANILVAPVDMSGSLMTITLTDEDEKTYEVTTAGKNMLQGKAYLYAKTMPYTDGIPYITFTADAEQTLKFAAYEQMIMYDDEDPVTYKTELETLIANLEYSINNQDWVTMSGPSTIVFGGTNGNLRIRGKNPNGTSEGIDSNTYSNISFGNETPVSCSGDIRTLVDFENYASVSTNNVSFIRLFEGCTPLTQAPELPATTLASGCYKDMFENCTSLTQAPELPATTLARNCYSDMFSGCTSLTQAPELPATTLANNCYCYMFKGCTSLTQAPELPATTLASLCYYQMFSGCTSLTQAPELPATALAQSCYFEMFYNCTSLTQAPELPATTLAQCCYSWMFYNCTSLTQAPELPATTLASNCYEDMFENCTSLTRAPELPATTLADDCYNEMFQGCTSLTQAPELPATTLAYQCYYDMFSGCTSLTQAPELPATTLATGCYSGMFSGCTSLTQAPELPATSLAFSCYEAMFYCCTKLNYIKMMATDKSATSCLNNWVAGVSSTGTFVKNKQATWNVTGVHGIPSGWTVITE